MKSRKATNPDGAMSVAGHFQELRKRLMLSLLGLAVGMTIGWSLYEPVMEFIQRPLIELSGSNTQLNFQTIGAAFELQLKVSFWVGVILSSPWWIFQIGAFIGPGLKRGEKIHAISFGLVGMLMFGLGAVAGALFVPRVVAVLLSYIPDDAAALLSAVSFVNFYMYLVLAIGLSFLLPVILVALNFLGVLSVRAMLRGWRWAVVVAFVLAAVLNPMPDPLPMILQALVLVGFYFMAVGVSALRERRLRRAATKLPTVDAISPETL